VLPAYIALEAIKWFDIAVDASVVQAIVLHATAFLYGIGSVFVVFLTLSRLTYVRATAFVGSALLLIYPLWMGYSFFDYKDLATAFFFALAVWASLGIQQEGSTRRHRWMWFLAVATIGAADTKLAALALIVPAWVVAAWCFGRISPWRFVVVCIVTTIGILLTTLPSWTDPIGFAVSSIEYMSHHAWVGCTLTDGVCTGTHTPQWAAWRYALAWIAAQLPLVVLIGILPAIAAAFFRGWGPRILAISLVWPLGAIGVDNSVLYDGLRHLLFAVPLTFALVVLLADQLIARWSILRFPLGALAVGMVALAAVDNVRLFPFNYSYFNLAARQSANESLFETDYWGFSLKQAAQIAAPMIEPGSAVVAGPSELVTPFLPPEPR
jgi:hypothetical protein